MTERTRARIWLIFLAAVATHQVWTAGPMWGVGIAYLIVFAMATTIWAVVVASD